MSTILRYHLRLQNSMSHQVLSKAAGYCESNKLRLTEPRQKVLKIISNSHKPLGAYEVLEELAKTITNPKPPTAYRAIDFWQKHGFVHRIESLNAYIACEAGHKHQGSQFMICDDCGSVIETHLCELPEPLNASIQEKAFIPSSWNLEIHGVCEKCV